MLKVNDYRPGCSLSNRPIKKRGFTLIELLIVIAVVGVLSTLAVIALSNARAKSRDSKRSSDIKQISTALELYFADHNSYPTIITPGQPLKSVNGEVTYLNQVPSNPSPRDDGDCPDSDYAYTVVEGQAKPTIYNISTCLGKDSGNYSAGNIAYFSSGLFKCGETIADFNNVQYDTELETVKCKMIRVIARLSSLSINGAPAIAGFDGKKNEILYKVTLPVDKETFSVTPTGTGTITVKEQPNGPEEVVASGATSNPIPLGKGKTKDVTIVVTEIDPAKPEEPAKVTTYTISVTREAVGTQTIPVFNPGPSAIAWGTTITITSESADHIYYTTDGTDPTVLSTEYTVPVAINSTSPLKAIATRTDYYNSPIASASYTQATTNNLSNIVLSGSPSNYNFSPGAYDYTGVAVPYTVPSITVTPTGQGTITVKDETTQATQTVASGTASTAITLNNGEEKTITVTATETGKLPRAYTIKITKQDIQATPTFSPGPSAVAWGTGVTISSANADAIYYTTDGSTPTASSTNQATTPLVINGVWTVKAMAVRSGYINSDIASASYTQIPSADLTSIVLSGSPSNYTFSAGTYAYNSVTVLNAVSSITITPTGAGTITVEGETVASGNASSPIALTASVEKTIVVATTEVGKATKTYTIYVKRDRDFVCGDNIVDSRDSKSYATVTIGTQCWMKQNLNIGTMVNDSDRQMNDSLIEKYCYGNSSANCTTYGALYQWPEAMALPTSCVTTDCSAQVQTPRHQGICPVGWHMPTDTEFKTLEMYLGMTQVQADATGWRGTDQGTKLKVAGSSGFNGMLAGYILFNFSFSHELGNYGYFWSSNSSSYDAYQRGLVGFGVAAESAQVDRRNYPKRSGLSVRCVGDGAATADLSNIVLSGTPASYTFNSGTYTYNGANVSNSVSSITVTPTGAGTITVEGETVASGSPSSPINLTAGVEKTITIIAKEAGKYAKAYTISVMRENAFTCGDNLIDSRDSQSYTTVSIGTQCWMKKNLNIGTMINDSSRQENDSLIEKYCYGNSSANCTTYGALYQWPEAMGLSYSGCINSDCSAQIQTPRHQGICPIGWHMPTDTEFKTLEMYLGMTQAQADATGWRGTDQGTKLKVAGSSGFNGMLAGYIYFNFSFSHELTRYGYFWSSTQHYDTYYAYQRGLVGFGVAAESAQVDRRNSFKRSGYSVRCVKH